jgi:hypothetical protein
MMKQLPNDATRCYGVGCNESDKCLRNKSIALDTANNLATQTFALRSYMAGIEHDDKCHMFIGVDNG